MIPHDPHRNGVCYIVAAAEFCGPSFTPQAQDLLIAADGGLEHLLPAGRKPDILIGDLDSLHEKTALPDDTEVYPVMKDDTDSVLALRRGIELGYRSFRVYGGCGGKRISHTVANLQALVWAAKQGCEIIMYEKNAYITALHNGEMTIARTDGYLSVFALDGDAEGVTLSGVKYPMQNAVLSASFPLGVSNEIVGEHACITVENGTLLIIRSKPSGEVWAWQ